MSENSYSYVYDGLETTKDSSDSPKKHKISDRNIRRIIAWSGLLLIQAWIILTLSVFHRYLLSVQAAEKPLLTPVVLGAMTDTPTATPISLSQVKMMPTSSPLPTPTPTFVPSITPTPKPENKLVKPNPPRDSYKIAVVGDSMVDTMGERLEYLEHALVARYPNTQFSLYNYGRGSENAEDVLKRFHEPFKHVDRDYPKIDDVKPDIIVVGSTGYNVFSPYFLDRHWLALTHLVQEAQKITPHVYMLAEIAPLREAFTKGPMGPNYDTETAVRASGEVTEQVQNAIRLSPVLNVPVIDAYTPSLASNRPEGKPEYVNPSDGLHPSIAGHEFMAGLIADTITLP